MTTTTEPDDIFEGGGEMGARMRALDWNSTPLGPARSWPQSLKTIVRGYTWTVTPITWRNRRSGESKLKIKEMGSRYLFIALYCWLEKYFSRGDYLAK